MSIKINKDNGTAETFTVILSFRDKRHLGEIINVSGMKYNCYLNRAQELLFNVHKYANGTKERLWDDITDLKLVYVKEINTYFEINVSMSDGDCNTKSVSGKSLCECELSQKMLHSLEINTESDIARDDYIATQFYNPNKPKASLLHRVLSEAPAYTIKYVDPSLMTIQRSFSVNDKPIYDFLTDDCATGFDCIFLFDSVDRSISVYDLYTVCNDCGYRGDFSDTCPKCNSHNLKYFGNDTTILVSSDNLTDEIQFETDIENVKNCLVLEAGDDIMTAAVMSYIPSGGKSIFYVSPDQQKDMPMELTEKIRTYNLLYDSSIDNYHNITESIYECIERITYHTSKQMPEITIPDTTASTEAAKLTVSNLNPLSLSSLTSYTSLATVNSALINYAKVYVRSGFVKIEVDTGSFKYNGTSNGINSGVWTGRIKVTSYSNKEDVAYSGNLAITVNDDYQSFMNEKILKNIASNNTDDGSVYNVLGIKGIADFKNALKSYCLNRLISFRDAINGVLSVLLEANGGNEESELYAPFYSKYYEKLQACNDEISVRKSETETWEKKKEQYELQKINIQKSLDFKAYLDEDLYNTFTTYIRESKYTNSNYISDGLSDDTLFLRAQEFMETARKELVKSSHYQHNIRANMYNLLLMDEFSPIVDNFQLGNFIRAKVDEDIYRLRLVSYSIDFDNLNTINTEFSDMTQAADGMNDIHGILKQASSMASTYSYVSKQASNGHDAQNMLTNFKENGLNSALVNIKNNDNEEIILGKNGLIAQSHDDITDSYSPEKLRLTHNLLVYTVNDFRTVKCALGKHDYYKYIDGKLVKCTDYGLTADFVTAGVVNGSQIIAGDIYSANYSSTENIGTHFNLNDSTFTFGDGKIVYDGKVLKIKGVEIDWDTTNESANMWASINANTEGIKLESKRASEAEGVLNTKIDLTAEELRLEAKNTKEGLESYISLTAGQLQTELKNTKEGLEASITTTAKDIRSEMKKSDDNLSSLVEQNAGKITSEIQRATSAENSLSTKITQTEIEIKSELKNTKEGLESSITSTAGQLRTELENTKSGLESSITMTAESLNTNLRNTKTALETSITIVSGNITSEITRAANAEGSLSTKIAQAENQIVLKADANGKIVQVALNANPSTGTEFKVDANNINLSATDVINMLSGGTINLSAMKINITSDNWSVDSQGNMKCNSIDTFKITGDAVKQFNSAIWDSETMQRVNEIIAIFNGRMADVESLIYNDKVLFDTLDGMQYYYHRSRGSGEASANFDNTIDCSGYKKCIVRVQGYIEGVPGGETVNDAYIKIGFSNDPDTNNPDTPMIAVVNKWYTSEWDQGQEGEAYGKWYNAVIDISAISGAHPLNCFLTGNVNGGGMKLYISKITLNNG